MNEFSSSHRCPSRVTTGVVYHVKVATDGLSTQAYEDMNGL